MNPDMSPPPEIIRLEGNHLTGESSLYLLQHAHNPVDWYPWGNEAFDRARREDKPIFLSIGYSSCHWCHVMEHEVFENDSIAEYMNSHFVSIKVDREERPDIDASYMDAVRAITGGGGWPLSVFLTPELKPFYGGTYFPPKQFMQLTRNIVDIYSQQRDKVYQQGEQLYNAIAAEPNLPGSGQIDSALLAQSTSDAMQYVDLRWGGFRGQMKFPTPLRWQYLLHRFRKTGEEQIAEAVRLTLDNMASGGIFDHIGGGFHRYTTEQTWLIPHFEKMLYDNAQLANLYIEASAVFRDTNKEKYLPAYEETARKTLDFMLESMQNETGGFYASYDADSGGEEGSYYIWTVNELTDIAGEEDGKALSMILGVTQTGNFDNKNILTRRMPFNEVAARLNRDETDIAGLFEKWRPVLKEHRNKRVGPGLDKKIVTAWNGLAISALSQGYALFRDDKYKEGAENAINYLWVHHRYSDGSLTRASNKGANSGDGILDDYAFFANGLVDYYTATGELRILENALRMIEYVKKHFGNNNAGFYLTNAHTPAPLGRQLVIFDSVEPSGNSAMLLAMLKAAAITSNTDYRDRVGKILEQYSGTMRKAGLEMALWLDVAQLYNGPMYEIILVGDKDCEKTDELLDVYRKLSPSFCVLTVTSPEIDNNSDLVHFVPAVEGKIQIGDEPTVYVCKFGSCEAPTSDPDLFRKQFMNGWNY